MNTHKQFGKWAGVVLLTGLGLWGGAGCVQPTTPTTNTTTTTNSTPFNPPVGVVNNSAGFYVNAQLSPNYTYITHKGAESGIVPPTYTNGFTWSQQCVAAVGDDIMCYVEAAEYDLFFNGAVLQHNVPSNMCTYFTVKMPWHFKYPAGVGPSVVSSTNTTVGTTTSITDTANSSQGVAYCPLDYSSTEGLPNCCEGTYLQTLTSTGGAAPIPPPTTTKGTWGGKASNCAAGPAMDLQPLDINGFPTTEVFYSAAGLNSIYTIPSPISKGLNTNMYLANYFDIATTKNYNTFDATVNNTGILATDFPPAFNQAANAILTTNNDIPIPGSAPAINSTGLSISSYSPRPYYEYTCYDKYKEVISRIRVMVRSWDVKSQIGTATDFTPGYGIEGGVGATAPLHDFLIWGDLFFNYADTTGAALRKSWANTGVGQANCGTPLTPIQNVYSTAGACRKGGYTSYLNGFPQSAE
jgi:hypothetical protein